MKSSSATLPTSQPKYLQFADHLRRQIEQGALKPGDRLPSRTEIREQHRITQPTIERAQAILEREGLIVRRERLGVFVAAPFDSRGLKGAIQANSVASVAAGTIGILAPGEGEIKPGHRQPGWSDYIAQGALAACREQGKHALFLNPARLQGDELKQLLAQPPLGFVFASLTSSIDFEVLRNVLQALQKSGQAVVVFGNQSELSEFDRVACDHETGCYELTRWLIGRGCRRILPLWPPVNQGEHWLAERLAGYRRAMREANLDALPVREVPSPLSLDESAGAPEIFEARVRHKTGYLAEFLGSQRNCDAILAVSDGEVPTTAAACRLFGQKPNQDVLIAGYDNYWRDVPESAFEPTTPIATVDKHNWKVGQELVRLLLARVVGELTDEPQLRWVQPELVPIEARMPLAG